MTWSDTLSDNGIMMEEGEAAKALALGISEKTALSGGTTSVDVSGMCSSLFESIDWGFCDAVDQVISVIAPRFIDSNSTVYSSSIHELITVAGFTTAVYGATNGEVRLRNGGTLFDSEWIEQRKGILNLFVTASTPVADAVFSTTSLNSNDWTYSYGNISGATTTLPHSVDAIGSTATPTLYNRGTATYETNVTLSTAKRYYLYLEPVYQRADVVLSGHTIYGDDTNIDPGSTGHVFTTELPGIPVVIDLTGTPFANGGNTITIKTDNTSTYYYAPFNGLLDIYNMFGGATLCEAGKLCFDPVTYGTRRCHLYFSSGGALIVKVAIKNNSNQATSDHAYIAATVYLDGSTAAIHSVTDDKDIDPGDTEPCTLSISFNGAASETPWNVGDGKRFRVVVQLYSGSTEGTLVDTIEDYCGYRTFSVAKHTSNDNGYGLTLNGSTCSLYGVTYHHWDRMPTTEELDADWEIITALKPQMIRFAYFPALHYLLDKCDEAGIVAMLELPWMHDFHSDQWTPGTPEAYRNAWRHRMQHNVTDMAVAMANEFFNHPSVLFYCIGTGFGVKKYHEWFALQAHTFITDELLPALQAVDSSRLVCIEMADTTQDYGPPVSWTDIGDIILERMNSGWGSGAIGDAVSEANTWNGRNSTIPMAILDWSYGANPEDHVEWSSASTKPADTGLNNAVEYPEEYQAYCVEQYADSALALKWPVFNLYGTVFDFAASNVSAAGGKSGVLQTGLVTRDRSVFKDAYYYLKARWNSEPMVYVTQKRNMDKESSPVTLRIYTNCNYVKVYSSGMTLLDTIQRSSGSYVVTKSVELDEGNNVFYVTGHSTSSGESTCSDSVTVHFEDTSGTTRIQIFSDSAIVNSGRVNAVVLPSTEPQGVTWSSETPTIATVNSGGTVTVLLDGSATIRATSTNDSNLTKTKVIPCYVRGATDSLYYQACLQADDPIANSSVTYRGITLVCNRDGSFTLNGTLTSGAHGFKLWPCVSNGSSMSFNNCAMFPVWDIPGDQLITCEITGGTITGTASGSPFTLIPVNETYTSLNQAALKPMNAIDGSGDVNAKLIVGSTVGFASFWLNTSYPVGTVFDNVTVKVQSFKQANTYFNSGLLESHMESPNTIYLHDKDALHIETGYRCNMYSRNADGSHSEVVANPNNGSSIPPYGRVTDGFAIAANSVPVSGATIAEAGTVLKFTAIMKNWPGNYQKKDDNSEWSFRVWYADGTVAAKLTWAYQDDDSGVDFTGGTASTIFTATKTVDSAGWYRHWFAWGNTLNCTSTCTFYLKLEEVDPTNVPPSTVEVYAGDRIINSGKLGVACLPAGTNQSVTWSSSNTSVATIDSSTGQVTVVADGQCTFTATSTLDNTKTGSATVSCRKVTSTNLIKNIFSVYDLSTTLTGNGLTLTNNQDGTYTLDGTLSSTSATLKIVPVSSSTTTVAAYFPIDGITGDMLIWAEYVSGTINGVTNLSNNADLRFRVYDTNNSEISAAGLYYKEIPGSSTECHSVLVTGSTAGVRRMTVTVGRPTNTVFDNYTFRLGLEKLSSLGLVYSGGVAESSMIAPCQAVKATSRNPIVRYPDGSFWVKTGTTLNWSSSQKVVFTFTGTPTYYSQMSNVPVTAVVAASGKTYKLRAEFLRAFTFDTASMSSDSAFRFFALGANRTELATLNYYASSAYSADFVNNVAEITFTATEDVAVLGFYANKIKPQTTDLLFALSLTEVTT